MSSALLSKSLLIFTAPEYIWSQNSIALRVWCYNIRELLQECVICSRELCPSCCVQSDFTRNTEQFPALCIQFFSLVHITVPACRAPSAPGAVTATTDQLPTHPQLSEAAAPLSCTRTVTEESNTSKAFTKNLQDKTDRFQDYSDRFQDF